MRETTANSHIDETTLSLYIDNLLSKEKEAMVEQHLEICEDRRCSEILNMFVDIEKMAEQIEKEKQLKPANNPNYKRFIPLAIASSILLTVGTLPAIQNFPDEVILKGGFSEKSFIDKSIYYWECRFNEVFGGKKQ
jgi:predicted anti-sigma-YlaC factor YlaD